MGIYLGSGLGGGSGDRHDWEGEEESGGQTGGVGWEGERVGIDGRNGVGGVGSWDRQEEWGERGREWG